MNRDPRIDAYIARAQPFARPILEHVRKRVSVAAPEAEETLKWSAPAFTVERKILLVMAAFKAHAAVNFWQGKALGLDQATGGMGQLGKLTTVADLPPNAEFDALIRKAAALSESGAKAPRPKPAAKPAPELHPEFAAALSANPQARATLDSFPPSARRDYLEWIADAKRDSTRARRIATAIEWLRQGKRHNWRYERN